MFFKGGKSLCCVHIFSPIAKLRASVSMSRAEFWVVLSKAMRSRKCRSLASYLSGCSQRGLLRGVFPWGFLKPARLATGRNHSVFLRGPIHVYCSTFLLSYVLERDLLSLEIQPAADLRAPRSSPYQSKVLVSRKYLVCA